MNYRKDRYGKDLSVLGYGCMRFPRKHGKIDMAVTEKLICDAVEQGINYFDTAHIYQKTDSEKFLGEVLKKYPRLKLLGHSQVFWIEMSGDAPAEKEARNQWGDGPVIPGGRVPELFEKYPNLYGDLSANSGSRAIMRDPEFGLAFLEKYADRLFFATDMVNKDMEFPLGAWLDEMAAAGKLSEETYEKIVRGNAQRIFGL